MVSRGMLVLLCFLHECLEKNIYSSLNACYVHDIYSKQGKIIAFKNTHPSFVRCYSMLFSMYRMLRVDVIWQCLNLLLCDLWEIPSPPPPPIPLQPEPAIGFPIWTCRHYMCLACNIIWLQFSVSSQHDNLVKVTVCSPEREMYCSWSAFFPLPSNRKRFSL